MADLSNLLLASLNPNTRKQAEQSLNQYSNQPGFLPHLLALVLQSSQDRAVRLAGSIYLKNITKLRWEEDVQPLAEADKATLRERLVPAMLALSNTADKSVRTQVAEAVSLIAELDFPAKWSNLIDQLISSLSPNDYSINIGVLQTAHSIFRQWRALVRSDELFSTINLVLEKFMVPFLQLFRQTATLLLNKSPTTTKEQYGYQAQSMVLLVDIFYDLTCQDLPPAIEDANEEFWAPQTGWWQVFITWDPIELKGDVRTTFLFFFVQGVWNLVGSNKLPSLADDGLVSQALRFLSTSIRSNYYTPLFSSTPVLSSLISAVIIPNITLREHEIEQFEDDPLEYVRLDLGVVGGGETRRQAAADVLKAFVGSGMESAATEIVGGWIGKGLEEAKNKGGEEGWKAKDAAVFLLTAVATRGSTVQHGVTSTNALVDVVKFFGDHVFQDLQAQEGTVHPILQVDAIRFLYTFRNQLTKEQLLSVMPFLVRHLGSDNYVTYTYAAITIDKILFIKKANQLLFAQADIHDFAVDLVNALLGKIESGRTPEKVAENDHLMKCIMRVIVTARQTLTPVYERILSRLVAILGVISKNPSNPNFDQYIFESISGLMRFVVIGTPGSLLVFEKYLLEPFNIILQADIEQYIPYVFQVLAQMLEFRKDVVAPQYRALMQILITPATWQQKGSIPGLVRLLKAFLSRDAEHMTASGQLAGVLAVVQQRLIPSKLNDAWGFELLQAVVQYVKPGALQQFMKPIIMTLLTRMQTSKTDKFVYLFSKFLLFISAINVPDMGPDYIIAIIEEIQPRLWSQILCNFVIPQAPKVPHRDRKLAVVGVTRLLCKSKFMVQEPSIQAWPATYAALGKLFSEPQYFNTSEGDANGGITEIDTEEQTAGYQAAYSRLVASETPEADPVGYVQNPQQYLEQEMAGLSKLIGEERVKSMIAAAGVSI
ncbi:armadillo-type protein [Cyathus striatus]|nr:armadillo-type protein [Cyathus striatus]